MKKRLLLLLLSFTVAQLFAQNASKLTGKIVDAANNQPLAGVTIIVKATKKGASTDANGNYTIAAKEGDEVEISYLGYNTETTKITANALVKITANAGSNLQDVVVVGYGTQKRANLTAAVATVKGEQLIQRPSSNTSMALQGFVPGLTVRQSSGQPGADGGQLNIRGIGSLTGGVAPLIVVDGVEGASLNDVDPNIIESVSVLKDAASTAVYGVRATNGVILIKTKRGQNGKTSIAFNSFANMQVPTNMPVTLSSVDDMLLNNEAVLNANSTAIPRFSQATIDLYRNSQPDNFTVFNTDWQKAIFQNTGLMQNHNIIVSGGSEKSSFLASGTYLNQQGLIVNNQFKKWDLRLNGDVNITKKIKFTTDLFYTKASNLTPAGAAPVTIIQRAITMARYFPSKFDNGLYGNAGQSNWLNPLGLAESSGTVFTETPTISVRFAIEAELFKNFIVNASYNNRSSFTQSTNASKTFEVYRPGAVANTYTLEANNVGGDSSIQVNDNRFVSNQYYLSGTYSFTAFKEHNFKAQIGFQALDELTTSNSGRGFGWSAFDRPYLNLAAGAARPSVSGGATDNSVAGVFSRINYDFRGRYFVELTARRDGSSRFSQLNDKQIGFFPGASAGWVISKENFFKNVPVVNYAKLRLSYGALGNQVVPGGPYPFVSRFNPRVDNYFNGQYTNGTALQNVQNIDIGWETSIQKNIGIDLGLLKNKLNVSFDYYEKQINDMIVDLPLVLYAGLANAASTVPTNVGSMINKGWELSINYKNKIGKDFNYNVTVNLSDVSNMVTNLNGQTVFTSEGLVAREGFPANGFLGYRTSGLFQRGDNTTTPAPTFRTPTNPAKEGDVRYLDLNGDGVVNANDDRTLFGFNFPRYEYSVDLNASYKGFDISVFVFGVGKRGNYMSGIGVNPFSGGWVSSGLETMLNRWTPNNTNTNYPRLGGVGNFETSDFWMRDGAFMRIRHITLGYNLPKSILAKANMQQCRFYVSVVNPFTFSNYEPGFDPEPTNNASSFYPIMKTYTAGFNIKF